MSPCPECQSEINQRIEAAIRHERELREASEKAVALALENSTIKSRALVGILVAVAVAIVGFLLKRGGP